MANTYVNKVQLAGGTSLVDISDSTAVASDVTSGKYFYLASGQKVQGSRTGGISLSQDANGYVVLPTTGEAQIFKAKTVTQSGTYNASSDGADGYSSVIVNAGTVNIVTTTSGTIGSSDNTLTFTGLNAEPIAFFVCMSPNASSVYCNGVIVVVLYNGTSTEGYYATGTNGNVVSTSHYTSSSNMSFTYSSGTLAITYTYNDNTGFHVSDPADYELTYIY